MHQSSLFLSILFKETQFYGNTLSFLSLFVVFEITKTKKFTVKRNKNLSNEKPRNIEKIDSYFFWVWQKKYCADGSRFVPKRYLGLNSTRTVWPGSSVKRYELHGHLYARIGKHGAYNGKHRLKRLFFKVHQRLWFVLYVTSVSEYGSFEIVLFDEQLESTRVRMPTSNCLRAAPLLAASRCQGGTEPEKTMPTTARVENRNVWMPEIFIRRRRR